MKCWFCNTRVEQDKAIHFDNEVFCSEACLWTYKKIRYKDTAPIQKSIEKQITKNIDKLLKDIEYDPLTEYLEFGKMKATGRVEGDNFVVTISVKVRKVQK